jgi:hypothetical protein
MKDRLSSPSSAASSCSYNARAPGLLSRFGSGEHGRNTGGNLSAMSAGGDGSVPLEDGGRFVAPDSYGGRMLLV